jgi:hypothetical protein
MIRPPPAYACRMRAPIARALGLAACFAVMGAVAAGPARISVDSPSVMEGDGPGPATLDFTLTRSGDTGSAVTLGYRVDDNTAVAPADYVALLPSTLTLAAGQTHAVIPVTINGDTLIEGDESLFLHLTGIVSVQGAAAGYVSAGTFSADSNPASVTATDIDGDGRPDLAVANAGSDSISVLLNATAPGSALIIYAAATDFAAGAGPRSITAADFDGDGRPDLAVANTGSDNVSVLRNATAPGSGVITYGAASDFAAGTGPRSVTAADFDGDGRPDLAVANSGSGSVSVLRNTTEPGSGVITYAAAGDFAAGTGPRSVTAADFDGDGRPDLAVANADSDDVSVLLNTTEPGSGVIAYAAATAFAVGDNPHSAIAADFDGDGRPDLAVANAGSDSVSVLLNTTEPGTAPGSGVITYAPASVFAAGNNPRSVTSTDADGDGRPDLATANTDGDSVSVLLNTTAPGTTVASFADAGNFAAGNGAVAVAATDVDGDGRPDLAVANSSGVAMLLNRPAVLDVSEGTGTLENDDASITPDAFHFVDQADVERDTDITSAAVTITGITVAVRIAVVGGKYSIGCTDSFRSSSSTIGNGKTVCVRHTSSKNFGTVTDTLLTVGGVADTFTSTTEPDDIKPDPFRFNDVTNALLNSPQVSNSVTIRGIRGDAPVSVTGGEYSVGCTATFTGAAGTISSGETVCVRHTSSALHGTVTDTTLTVGGVSDTFTSTTPAAQDFSKTAGALAPLDALLLLLAALGSALRRRAKKIRSRGCPCERIFESGPAVPSLE